MSSLRTYSNFILAAKYVFVIAICFLMILPFIWALVTSLKPLDAIMSYPPQWIPRAPTLSYFLNVVRSSMPRYFLNSILVSLGTILVSLGAGSLAGYSLARFDFPGKGLLMVMVLMNMMVPGVVNLVPVYLIASSIGILDTYLILILVYSVWQIPIVVWLMKDFFETIPSALDKAAMIDGYSPLQAFIKIILPLSRPGLVAAAIMVFVYAWNEFIIAQTLTSSDNMRTIPVGLHYYITVFGVQWGELCSAVLLALLPIVSIFICLQRYLLHGMVAGALKG